MSVKSQLSVRTVFLDTVGLVGLWDESDQWHSAAQRAYDELRNKQPVRLVSTTVVLLECGNAAARRAYRRDVFELWQELDRTGGLIRPTDEQVSAAWAVYAGRPPGGAGIVDEISFGVMRAMGIQEAFTNDSHFRAAGFRTLIT